MTTQRYERDLRALPFKGICVKRVGCRACGIANLPGGMLRRLRQKLRSGLLVCRPTVSRVTAHIWLSRLSPLCSFGPPTPPTMSSQENGRGSSRTQLSDPSPRDHRQWEVSERRLFLAALDRLTHARSLTLFLCFSTICCQTRYR